MPPRVAGTVAPVVYHGGIRIDLHTHSSASDGTEPPAEVMRRADAAGVAVVALTDHDTTAGHEEARRHLPRGLTLVPGMELSCRLDGRSLHLLAYLFDPAHPDLAAECAAIRDDRRRRGRAMVAKLNALGVDISWEGVRAIAGDGVVGRPHVARALAAAGVVAEPRLAFSSEWIGTGGRAYVGRYALDPAVAVGLVRAAGGVSVLAHPRAGTRPGYGNAAARNGEPRRPVPRRPAGSHFTDDQIRRLADAGLTGVEIWHPDHDDAERARLTALADELDLVATGSSDDHGGLTGHRIGCETTPAAAYERLVERAVGSAPVRGAAKRGRDRRRVPPRS